MKWTMDGYTFKEGNCIIVLYGHQECVLISYLHKKWNLHKII
jgi:hypothetical protein